MNMAINDLIKYQNVGTIPKSNIKIAERWYWS